MSEKQVPEEPLIIKTDHPHTVSMPEGTNVAVGKKGEAGAPAVRKVMADGEHNLVENVVMDGGVSKSNDPSKDVMAHGETYKGHQNKEEGQENFKGYQSPADAPDRFVAQPKDADVPSPGKKSIDLSQLNSILQPKASSSAVDTSQSEQAKITEKQVAKAAPVSSPMADMNFPARVIQVKIENDLVRERLERLE
jgi:hypothetical protein